VNSSAQYIMFYSFKGNKTNNYKGAIQDFDSYFVDLKVYS